MSTSALHAAWRSLWSGFGVAADSALCDQLVACYAEPHRHYHTAQHLEECFALLEPTRHLAQNPEEIALALWFHDAIYDTKRKDNEDRCAAWAREVALDKGLTHDSAQRIAQLVLVTKHDAVPAGSDAELLVDIDLAILGATAARFDEYEDQVRREYSWVPAILYRRERRRILEEFARRPTLYSTPYFRDTRDRQARANLARSIERL
jgi:predicted metal-dependent HD superfamily phosphohydrolase